METPGWSIFQGGVSIKLDSSIDRAEEEEALEDRRRRDEELNHQLQNAFDDLLDDDQCSIDASIDPQSQYQPSEPPSDLGKDDDLREQQNQHFHYAELIGRNSEKDIAEIREHQNEVGKLEKMLESKAREVENLSKFLHEERKRNDELKKRLALSDAEKERAQMTVTQTHELLVDSKSKISEMEASMNKLETTTKSLEDKNMQLVGELERTKLQLSDALQKYRSVERNASHTADLCAENMIRDANGRHVAQMTVLQQQINSLQDKLDVKEREYTTLDIRYKELQRNREALLIEKSNAINQLARSLEDSQKHCQELMANKVDLQENKRLQGLVHQFQRQAEDMQQTINNLTARLEATSSELNLMEEYMANNTSFGNLFHGSIGKDNLPGDSPKTIDNRIVRLKDELYRSIAAQKGKREEIKRLQEQLAQQNDEIKTLKDSENNALIEISTTKEESLRLGNKLRLIETEINELRSDKDRADAIIKNLQVDLDSMKEENGLVCNKLAKAESDLEKSQKHSSDLQNEIDSLLEKLKTKHESDDLINELKEKALRFEEYIRNENVSKRAATKTTPPHLIDRAVSTSPEFDSDRNYTNYRRKVESTIRDEMAKVFAVKIESIESTFNAKYKDLEMENVHLQQNLRKMYDDLQTRESEVELLKQCILKEREKMSEQMLQINSFVDNVRGEMERKQQKLVQLQHDLDEKSTRIETERKSMKAVMEQWEVRQEKYERTVDELEALVEKMKQNHQRALDDMLKKYNSAKKTAANYKRYAEDKDKHIKEEYNRIKAGFDAKVESIKKKMESELENRKMNAKNTAEEKAVDNF